MIISGRTLFAGGGRSSSRREEGAPHHHQQEGDRDEEEQNGQPDQGLLPWWSWPFHLAAHLPMCVGQESMNECLAFAL